MNIGAQYLQNNTTHFTVWAPEKETVQLHIVHPTEQRLQMQKDKEGYFHITVENIQPGSRYFFMPDGKKDIPDPASNFQPEDVFGPSEVIDHAAYQWHERDWCGLPFSNLI